MEAEAPWAYGHAHVWPTRVGTICPLYDHAYMAYGHAHGWPTPNGDSISLCERGQDDEGVCRKPFMRRHT